MEWSPKDSLVSFSKLERGAIIILLLLIAIGGGSGYWLPSLWPGEREIPARDRDAFRLEVSAWEVRNRLLVDSIVQMKLEREQRYANKGASWNSSPRKAIKNKRAWSNRPTESVAIDYSIPMPGLESIDANTVDTNMLFRIGIPPRIARRWVKFRERGGSFVRKDDLGKLYGMPDSTLKRILPYIKVPDLQRRRTFRPEIIQQHIKVDVNVATPLELQKVRGIGPFFADRIVEYRSRLGGFISIEQLAETPGFRDSTFLKIRDKLMLSELEPRRIRINQVAEDVLAQHPYISKKQAEVVILNRRNHGKYSSRQDLLETIVLDQNTVDRLMPYLDFSE